MKHRPYPNYKPSGVEWLGDVPERWEVTKVSYVFDLIGSGTTPKSDADEFYNGEIPWVTTSELRENIIQDTKEKITKEALSLYSSLKIYPVGTVLFAMYGATIGRLGILGVPATVNQACCAFSGPKNIDALFLYYWLLMRRPILVSLSFGGGQPNLSQSDLRQIRIPLPPLPEQRAIAAFLDRETTRMDTLVAKKRELIERLKEKRTALISRTVTRGLPPDAARAAGLPVNPPLKPSGVEWLGDVPEHWEVIRNRFVVSINPASPCLRSLNIDDEVSFIPMEYVGIEGNLVLDQTKVLGDVSGGYTEFQNGDVILAKITPCFENGKSALAKNLINGAAYGTTELHVLRASKFVSNEFVFYVITSDVFRKIGESEMYGAGGQKRVPTEFVENFRIPLPPLPEQHAIADYLDAETAKIDALVAKVEAAIERLQEYRTALITAAVTGKVDVCAALDAASGGKRRRG